MNRLALRNGQKIVETTVRISSKKTMKSMDRLAIIQGQKTCSNNGQFFQ